MAAHDVGLLAAQEVELFAMWLKKNGKTFRVGKGEFQIIQVQLAKGWGAICRNAKGVVTTPQEIRPLIDLFKPGKSLVYATPTNSQESKSASLKAMDVLRDDLAMLAAESFLPDYRDLCSTLEEGDKKVIMDSLADLCYQFANSMLSARESTRTKEVA